MLPHVINSEAGRNNYEPVVNSLFRVTFIFPATIAPDPIMTEHVLSITGIKDPGPEAVQQTFGASKRNYASTDFDNTQILDVTMTLNLNNANQNYVAKKIREWRKAAFNPLTSEYGLKADYTGQMIVERLNKKFEPIWERTFVNAWCSGELTGIDDFDTQNHEPVQLNFQVTADYYTETEL